MIHVTQGHEKGIGLEVFFKAFAKLNNNHDKFILYANLDSIKDTAKTLSLDFKYQKNNIFINKHALHFIEIKKSNYPQSTISLEAALQNIKNKDEILLTLPTSKDQLVNSKTNKSLHGYTEYLRDHFKIAELTMSFISPDHTIALVTDHIPLNKVASTITGDLIYNKVNNALKTLSKIRSIKRIIIASINPHCGENGLLGSEDFCITEAIKNIKLTYPHYEVIGPVAGDTLQYHYQGKHDLLVYMYHDQGLAPFKFINGLIGINITCGLPFLRVSVDHGTSFELYGKNLASEVGCLYLLEELNKNGP